VVLTVFLISFGLTALGFVIAWPMDSSQAFHAIVNLFLIPLWLLSGALFPVNDAAKWMKFLMRLNPLTYGMDALRMTLFPATAADSQFPIGTSLAIVTAFCVFVFAASFAVANRRSTKPAA
jgi:ABC-2 type transport system permease protein